MLLNFLDACSIFGYNLINCKPWIKTNHYFRASQGKGEGSMMTYLKELRISYAPSDVPNNYAHPQIGE